MTLKVFQGGNVFQVPSHAKHHCFHIFPIYKYVHLNVSSHVSSKASSPTVHMWAYAHRHVLPEVLVPYLCEWQHHCGRGSSTAGFFCLFVLFCSSVVAFSGLKVSGKD